MLSLSLYEHIARPALFLTPPETAHGIAKFFFKRSWIWRIPRSHFCVEDPRLHINVGTLTLPNPVGLSAGFDKDCEMYKALFHIGFGYVTLGTVTLNSREGNPKPRMWRYPNRALVNSMGLPNQGAQRIAGRLVRGSKLGPMIISISGLNVEEFAECYRLVEDLGDGVELNISTPNTAGVRIFQDPGVLTTLLDNIMKLRKSGRRVWVKIPPYFDEKDRDNVLGLVDICARNSVDAITAINTKRIVEPRSSIGTGGLSGPPILGDMLKIVADIYAHTGGKIPINACGGISSGSDAWQAFEKGASSVQLYTALIYDGPGIISQINRQLLRRLEKSHQTTLADVTGTGVR